MHGGLVDGQLVFQRGGGHVALAVVACVAKIADAGAKGVVDAEEIAAGQARVVADVGVFLGEMRVLLPCVGQEGVLRKVFVVGPVDVVAREGGAQFPLGLPVIEIHSLGSTGARLVVDARAGLRINAPPLAIELLGGDADDAFHLRIVAHTGVSNHLNGFDFAGLKARQLVVVLHFSIVDIDLGRAASKHFKGAVACRNLRDVVEQLLHGGCFGQETAGNGGQHALAFELRLRALRFHNHFAEQLRCVGKGDVQRRCAAINGCERLVTDARHLEQLPLLNGSECEGAVGLAGGSADESGVVGR